MAILTLRLVKGSPLTHSEADANFTNLNNELATKLNSSSYTPSDVLAKLLTVDGPGSGLDADFLDGQSGAFYADIAARLGYTPVNKAGDTGIGQLVSNNVAGFRIQNAGGAFQIYKDGTPTKGARIAFNTADADGVALQVFDGASWLGGLRISAADNFALGADAPTSNVKFSARGVDQSNPTLGAVARFNSAGQISLRIGNSGYAYSWLQSIQDDGTNNLKNLVLNPSGGSVGVGMNPTEKLQVRLERGQVETYEAVQGVAFRALASNTYGAYTVYQEAGTAHSFVIGKQAGSDVLVLGDGDLSSFAIRWFLNSGGHFIPGANEVHNIGVSGIAQVLAIYARSLNNDNASPLTISAGNAGGSIDFRQGGASRADITTGGVFRYGGNEIGYRGMPAASVATGAFVASDRGKCVYATGGVTIPNGVMTNNDTIVIQNVTGSAITITKSITNAYNADTGATLGATFSLPARCRIYLVFTGSDTCYISGAIA